jgi:hypothetical protein
MKAMEGHFRGFQVWSVTNSEVPKYITIVRCEGHVSRDHVLRVEVLREEASVVSLKLLKPKVSKFLISIYHEGVHMSIDRELREKALRAKESIEELKLLKSEALKPGVSK